MLRILNSLYMTVLDSCAIAGLSRGPDLISSATDADAPHPRALEPQDTLRSPATESLGMSPVPAPRNPAKRLGSRNNPLSLSRPRLLLQPPLPRSDRYLRPGPAASQGVPSGRRGG